MAADDYFEKVVREGFERRRQQVWERQLSRNELKHPISDYQTRLTSEIAMIRQMGFPGYFLVVWDFVRYARERSIPVGPGRGSAAGSLVAYCLEISIDRCSTPQLRTCLNLAANPYRTSTSTCGGEGRSKSRR